MAGLIGMIPQFLDMAKGLKEAKNAKKEETAKAAPPPAPPKNPNMVEVERKDLVAAVDKAREEGRREMATKLVSANPQQVGLG